MSAWDDLEGVTPWISSEDAERLLSGTLGLDETQDLAGLDAVLSALRSPAEVAELAGLDSVVNAFAGANLTPQPASSSVKSRPMMKKLLSGKSLAAIGVVTLASAGAAAAAAGVVPTPFDSKPPAMTTAAAAAADESIDEAVTVETARDATPTTDATVVAEPSTVDIAGTPADAPRATDAAEVPIAPVVAEADGATAGTEVQGPDVNGPAKFGLCTAYDARTKHDAEGASGDLPVPFQALSDAAAAAGLSIVEFCADAVPGGSVDAPGKSKDNQPKPEPDKPKDKPDKPPKAEPEKPKDKPPKSEPDKPKHKSGQNDP